MCGRCEEDWKFCYNSILSQKAHMFDGICCQKSHRGFLWLFSFYIQLSYLFFDEVLDRSVGVFLFLTVLGCEGIKGLRDVISDVERHLSISIVLALCLFFLPFAQFLRDLREVRLTAVLVCQLIDCWPWFPTS